MREEIQKEAFSEAWLRAIVAVAGFHIFRADPNHDEESVDVMIRALADHRFPLSPKLDVQLKCTSQLGLKADVVMFRLKKKNYDDLRDRRRAPKLLVVLHVPDALDQWIEITEHQAMLKRCDYWCDLTDLPPLKNRTSITIRIPRNQIFRPETLTTMMDHMSVALEYRLTASMASPIGEP